MRVRTNLPPPGPPLAVGYDQIATIEPGSRPVLISGAAVRFHVSYYEGMPSALKLPSTKASVVASAHQVQ